MRMTIPTLITTSCSLIILAALPALSVADDGSAMAEPGTAVEPIRVVTTAVPDMQFHDAALPPVVGVHNLQVMRANRTQPTSQGADGLGWTYNHAPMLCYWKGRFYLEYLSNPVGEHIPPGHTLLTESADGVNWSRPRVAFPPFKPEGEENVTVSHQRMGFYVAPSGRLLMISFYGRVPRPNDGKGVGRAVREIREDGTLGPIHFVRYNRHAGFSKDNTPHPFYKDSEDNGFVAACDALLANKLMTQQWWEEDRSEDGFYAISGGSSGFDAKALSFYHRKDGAVVGLWKKRWTALSFDEGQSWTKPVRLTTLVTGGAKTWGQRTDDGRYAMAFNPHASSRWPLVVLASEDGVTFDQMRVAHGEIPYPRYDGQYKSMGPQYVRGITEGNGKPPGDAMWLTYSVNKEDIWVSRLPLPLRDSVEGPVEDKFDDLPTGLPVRGWNVYSPLWAPVAVAASPDGKAGSCLALRDEDLYDHAKAVRVFPAAKQVTCSFRVWTEGLENGSLEIEGLDRRGRSAVTLKVSGQDGWVARDFSSTPGEVKLAPAKEKTWVEIELEIDVTERRFRIRLDGKPARNCATSPATHGEPLERLCFRTGPVRDYDAHAADLLIDDSKLGDRLDGDQKQPLIQVYVDEVRIKTR